MLDKSKWKRLSRPLYVEELNLYAKAENEGLTEEEKYRLKYLGEVLSRFFQRFIKSQFSESKD